MSASSVFAATAESVKLQDDEKKIRQRSRRKLKRTPSEIEEAEAKLRHTRAALVLQSAWRLKKVRDNPDATIKQQRLARLSLSGHSKQWKINRRTVAEQDLSPEAVFMHWITMARDYIAEKKLTVRAFFKLFDRNGDGFLTSKEVNQSLCDFKGIELTAQEVKVLVKYWDRDRSGVVDYKEFTAGLKYENRSSERGRISHRTRILPAKKSPQKRAANAGTATADGMSPAIATAAAATGTQASSTVEPEPRIIERIVEVEKKIEVPVEVQKVIIVEKPVEVEVEKIVHIEVPVEDEDLKAEVAELRAKLATVLEQAAAAAATAAAETSAASLRGEHKAAETNIGDNVVTAAATADTDTAPADKEAHLRLELEALRTELDMARQKANVEIEADAGFIGDGKEPADDSALQLELEELRDALEAARNQTVSTQQDFSPHKEADNAVLEKLRLELEEARDRAATAEAASVEVAAAAAAIAAEKEASMQAKSREDREALEKELIKLRADMEAAAKVSSLAISDGDAARVNTEDEVLRTELDELRADHKQQATMLAELAQAREAESASVSELEVKLVAMTAARDAAASTSNDLQDEAAELQAKLDAMTAARDAYASATSSTDKLEVASAKPVAEILPPGTVKVNTTVPASVADPIDVTRSPRGVNALEEVVSEPDSVSSVDTSANTSPAPKPETTTKLSPSEEECSMGADLHTYTFAHRTRSFIEADQPPAVGYSPHYGLLTSSRAGLISPHAYHEHVMRGTPLIPQPPLVMAAAASPTPQPQVVRHTYRKCRCCGGQLPGCGGRCKRVTKTVAPRQHPQLLQQPHQYGALPRPMPPPPAHAVPMPPPPPAAISAAAAAVTAPTYTYRGIAFASVPSAVPISSPTPASFTTSSVSLIGRSAEGAPLPDSFQHAQPRVDWVGTHPVGLISLS